MSVSGEWGAVMVLAAVSVAAADEGRPRLYFEAAGLTALRRLAAQEEPCAYGFSPAAGWGQVLKRANALAEAPAYHYQVHIPAANAEHAGWDWGYTLSEQPPPRHDESKHYPPWTAMFQERSDSLTTRMKHFALAYLITGEERYVEKARDIVLKLIKWPYWTDPSYGGNLSACLDTGHCTQTVALVYDWLWDKFSESERQAIREALVRLGVEPIRKQMAGMDSYHNFWAVVNTGLGVAALALRGEDPRAEGWVQEAIDNTRRQFDSQGGDGGSFEGPMYGTYAADMLAELVIALDSTKTPHDLREHPFLATLPRYCVNGLSPDVKGLATFGDGGWGAGYEVTMAMLAAAGSEPARYYLYASGLLSGVDSIDRFLFYGPLLSRDKLPDPPAWRGPDVFADIGYAFLRGGDDEPFVAVKCGPPTKAVGHNHYDQHSFQMTARKVVVAADPGYRSYFDPAKRRYTSSSLGHSTVVLDVDDDYLASQAVISPGHDQVVVNGGRFTEFMDGAGLGFVTGEAAAAYNSDKLRVLDSFRRQFVYLPPNALLLLDDLAAPAPHRYTWLLHGVAGSRPTADGTRGELAQGGALLSVDLFAPGGVAWRCGNYPGAEAYGPYLAATAADQSRTGRFVAALVPRASPPSVPNGGFEDELLGWQIRAVDDQGPNHSASGERPHSGKWCGRIAGAGYFYSSRFVLDPGARFTVKAWYRTESPTKGAELVLYFWDAAGKAFANERRGGLKAENWTPVEIAATVPDGTATISVAFNYFDTGVGFLDDVELLAATPPANATPAKITPLGDQAAQGLVIEVDGWRHEVAFGSAGRVQTDGRLAVVSSDPDGRIVRALMQDATRLTVAGRELMAARARCTAAIARHGDRWLTRVRQDLTPHAEPSTAEAVGLRVAP